MSDKKEEVATAAAIGVSYTINIGDRRNIVVQSHVEQEGDGLRKLLFKIDNDIGLLEDSHTVKEYQENLKNAEADVEGMKRDLERLDSKVLSAPESHSTRGTHAHNLERQKEANEREAALLKLAGYEKGVARFKHEIKLIEARLHGATGTTDSKSCCSDS